jgi:hypothetical protein
MIDFLRLSKILAHDFSLSQIEKRGTPARDSLYIDGRILAVRYLTKNIQHQPGDQIRNLSLDSGDAAHSVFLAIFHAMVRLWLRFR